MLASFKKLKSKENEQHTYIPKELLKVLNQELPNGLKYVSHNDGMCSIEPVSDTNNTISMNIEIPESAKKYKGIIKTVNDLIEYAYRTQQTLQLKPYDDNTIIMNGNRIKMEQLIKFPLDDNKALGNGKFMISPPPFSELTPLVLEAGKISLEFQAERKPYDSMNEIYIQLMYKNLITIDVILNEQTSMSNWTIHMNANTHRASELYKIFVFYNNFGSGKVKYGGEKIAVSKKRNSFSFVDKDIIVLLDKLIKLEKKLNITFNIPSQLSYLEEKKVEQLYSSLILNKPFKQVKPFNELTCNGMGWVNDNDKAVEQIIDKKILITSGGMETVELFGQKIQLYLLQAIFNMLVKDVEIYDETTIKLKIDDKNKEMFASYRYFKNDTSAIRYQKNNKWIDIFEKAEEIMQ